MLTWNVGVDGSCILCRSNNESRNHLYFACRFSAEIWGNLVKNLLAHEYTIDWSLIIALLVDTSKDHIYLFLTRYVFQTALNTISRERNDRRHGKSPMMAKQLIQIIDKQVRNRLSTIKEMGDRRYDAGMEAWFASR